MQHVDASQSHLYEKSGGQWSNPNYLFLYPHNTASVGQGLVVGEGVVGVGIVVVVGVVVVVAVVAECLQVLDLESLVGLVVVCNQQQFYS